MTLDEVPLYRMEITSLLREKARRTHDVDILETSANSPRTAAEIREDSLHGRCAELVFEHQFLREFVDDEDWKRYDGYEFDYVLYPDTLHRTTIDVKSRVLRYQVEFGNVDPSDDWPWFNSILVRDSNNHTADVYVQAIISDDYITLTGWEYGDVIKQEGERVWKMNNNPWEYPQTELNQLSPDLLLGGGAS